MEDDATSQVSLLAERVLMLFRYKPPEGERCCFTLLREDKSAPARVGGVSERKGIHLMARAKCCCLVVLPSSLSFSVLTFLYFFYSVAGVSEFGRRNVTRGILKSISNANFWESCFFFLFLEGLIRSREKSGLSSSILSVIANLTMKNFRINCFLKKPSTIYL